MTFTDDVGARLRRIRLQQGLSLQDVERDSKGEWKAAVVGSYERGDRNISAARLCELAEFYGISPLELLPGDGFPRPTAREQGIIIDLRGIGDEERWQGLRRFLESIQLQRGDYNRQVLSIRGDDMRALAVIMDTTPQELLDDLKAAGVIRER